MCFGLLQVLVGHPQNYRGCGQHILCAMQSLSPVIHPDLQTMWDTVLPKLSSHLEGTTNCLLVIVWFQRSLASLLIVQNSFEINSGYCCT
jgi:hypothetical protein